MAQIYDQLNTPLSSFIKKQHMFFVFTAPKDGRINLSPKGLNCLRILDDKTVAYVNLTDSGNETSAHLLEDNRMTMMFCNFEQSANIHS